MRTPGGGTTSGPGPPPGTTPVIDAGYRQVPRGQGLVRHRPFGQWLRYLSPSPHDRLI